MADERRSLSFWQNKRVLITGHTGFIGSWLSYWLHQLGANVSGIALAPHTTPSLFQALNLDKKIHHTIADICDREALTNAFSKHQPEIVFHLAAQAIVGRAHAEAYETWRVNALGTVALLEAVHKHSSIRALNIFTTDKVYDNHETGHAHREGDTIGGHGIYDSSKGATELATRAFMKGNLLPKGTCITRAGNVIGGGDWNEARLVPDCARAFAQSQPVTLRHPESTRPWQHVLDLCHATLQLTQHLYEEPQHYAGAWNIGPDSAATASAATIAETLAKHWTLSPAWQQAQIPTNFPEAKILHIDSTKLNQQLGWHARLKLEESLKWCADWYRAWEKNPNDAERIITEQIEAYLALN